MPIGSPVALALLALGAPSFSSLSGDATPVNNLGRFLERYIGDCDHSDTPGFDEKACKEEVAAVRRKHRGKLIRVRIENLEGQLKFAGWDKRKNAFRLHLTPFFPERDVAMTVGKPKRYKEGMPVLRNIPVWVPRPDGEPEFAFRRRLERGMVRLDLLVRPKTTWRKARKDEDAMRGLVVELVALRLLPARGDKPLAERVFSR